MKKILIILLLGLCFYNIAFVLFFDKKYPDSQEVEGIYEIISLKEETEYYNKYMCKNNKRDKFILYSKNDYFPGDNIKIKGEFQKGETARNYKGFNYREYLKQHKIYGIIKSKQETYIKKSKDYYFALALVKNFFINQIEIRYESSIQSFLKGILVGNTGQINNNIKDSFRNSSMSHILAISGLHITYIVSGFEFVFSKIVKNKRKRDILLCAFLIVFCIFTGGSASCTRACIMHIMIIISGLLYRKNNFYISFIFSFIILLLLNPFNIYNVGMWLSYAGTFGVVMFSSLIMKVIKRKCKKIPNSIITSFSVSLSAQIMILPIMIYCFNTISLSFFIPNILISYIVGPILMVGYVSLFIPLKFVSVIEKILVELILKIAIICEKIPFSKIYFKTPNIIFVIAYYVIIAYLLRLFNNKKFYCLRCIINKKFLNKKIVWLFILILVISNANISIDNKLKVYFIDVGQGDCTMIKAPNNKTILIDGGEDFEGRVVLPYLLDRKITKIDYMIISHFDSDHVGGLLKIMEELKVKNIIISKQFQDSDNYETFKEIVNRKKIKVYTVQKGDKLIIEKNLYIDFLWPNNSNPIPENILNNNSIVCKVIYNNFSILFTGDIEEVAENEIVREYENTKALESTVLKVGHHGSRTSTTEDFIEKINPKIALIGVGENNKFGHPNEEVLERLETGGSKIYRTDEMGEIVLSIDKEGKIKIKKFIE